MDFLRKLKIFFLVFGVSNIFLFLGIAYLQTSNCRNGYLISPVFDFGTTTKFNKFLWYGTKELGEIEFNFCSSDQLPSDFDNCLNIGNSVSTTTNPGEIVYLGNLMGRYLVYKIKMESCFYESIPRVEKIFIYYNKNK